MQVHAAANASDATWDTILDTQVIVAKKTGGSTVNIATVAVLKKILDNSLAEKFSWDGKRKKKEFKVLLTAKVLRKAVHSMCQPDCTDLQIKTVASQWLAQAKIRRVRQELRANNRMNVEASNSEDNE
ncbi:uncharacterized protein [Temnothorax nylanderi]|uniref:uncharacterized protein n=1 Tax=Temnothorax nylanderi TaxID=102681 RepID=UPI003A8AB17F